MVADWFESHAASWARALSIDTPGFRRPIISMPTLSSLPRTSGTKSTRRERRPEVGRTDLETAEPLRHHADDFVWRAGDEHRASDHVGIAVELAPPSLVAQHEDGVAACAVIVGSVSARPMIGFTRTTRKKLADTRLTAIIRPSTRRSISFTAA